MNNDRAVLLFTSIFLLFYANLCQSQDIIPDTPATVPASAGDITIELLYLGLSKKLSERVTGQLYLAHGPDDDVDLGVADIGTALTASVQVGGRYQYFSANVGEDQHTLWAYLNAEKYFGSSWRIDTRQVLEQRLSTTGVDARTRYRPRFRASYFSNLAGRNYQIYAAVEPIFNLTDDNDDQVSWSGGAFFEMTGKLQLNLFYQLTTTDQGPDFRFPGIGLLYLF